MSHSDTLLSDQTPWPIGTCWRATARLTAVGEYLSRQTTSKRDAGLLMMFGCCAYRRRMRRLNSHERSEEWSGREDLNLRHPAPKAGALPGCATPRLSNCPTFPLRALLPFEVPALGG